jgi:hypothetical protein
MDNSSTSFLTNEDWFNQGKADAWAEKPKQPPEHDPQAASMYDLDLGYSEGEVEPTPTKSRTRIVLKEQRSRKNREGFLERLNKKRFLRCN